MKRGLGRGEMAESLADQIIRKIEYAAELYHRLVLVVGPAGSGKTAALQDVGIRRCTSPINVSLELARRMLELTERQRKLQSQRLLREIVGDAPQEPILLDNTEVIFDTALEQDPLRLFQDLSRNKTVVAAWNGALVDDSLIYAAPGHPEYRRYQTQDLLIASPDITE